MTTVFSEFSEAVIFLCSFLLMAQKKGEKKEIIQRSEREK
jgi:hypothetical protein